MTTLETNAGTTDAQGKQTTKPESAPAKAVEGSADTAALITEQQVLFASSAALAPARQGHIGHVAHEFASAVRAMFTRPEKPHARKHYPQRFNYLENSAMSREMDRL
jgi:hypothetical protein